MDECGSENFFVTNATHSLYTLHTHIVHCAHTLYIVHCAHFVHFFIHVMQKQQQRQQEELPTDIGSMVYRRGLNIRQRAVGNFAVSRVLGLLAVDIIPDVYVYSLPASLAALGGVLQCYTFVKCPFKVSRGWCDYSISFFMEDDTGRVPPVLLLCHSSSNAVKVASLRTGKVLESIHVRAPNTALGRGNVLAVSCWQYKTKGDHVVRLFRRSRKLNWVPTQVLAGGGGGDLGPGLASGLLACPRGVSFTRDGTGVIVCDSNNMRLSRFRVSDGLFLDHIAHLPVYPLSIDACWDGWVVNCQRSCKSLNVFHVGHDGTTTTLPANSWVGTSIGMVPGLGLLVHGYIGCGEPFVQVCVHPSTFQIASMSDYRIAWMSAVLATCLRS